MNSVNKLLLIFVSTYSFNLCAGVYQEEDPQVGGILNQAGAREELSAIDPETIALSRENKADRLTKLTYVHSSKIEFEGLARHLSLLALASEDHSFYQHYGLLSKGLINENSAELVQIQKEIALFWLEKGVKLKGEDDTRQDSNGSNIEHTMKGEVYPGVAALEPVSPDYLSFVSHIQQLLWLDSQFSWPEITLTRLVRLGDKEISLAAIAERLRLLGDLATDNGNLESYQDWLRNGVVHFQTRHGLKPDGVLGPKTMAWLNMMPYEKAKLLATNFVAKTRFLHKQGKQYLVVNIPAFELKLIDKGQEILQSRVIVGKPYRQTPLLSSEISNLVINPSWRVPRKIIYRDLLPQVRKDGEYITKRQFDVFDARGNKLEKTSEQWQDMAKGKFPYRLVQKPGELNALGRFKFHFANSYSVYLHDTPDKELFNQSNRALSSGCIRVESVTALANWVAANLVKDKQTWVEFQTNKQDTKWFSFSQRLPIHLVYWTAWVDKGNLPQFRDDIYKLAKKVELAVNN